jgi:hypothetical protein
MRKKLDENVENPRHDEGATGPVAPAGPASRAKPTSGEHATDQVQKPAWGDDDDPGSTAT